MHTQNKVPKKYDLDPYKTWIIEIKFSAEYELWEAKLKPNYHIQTPYYFNLLRLIHEKVAMEVIALVAEALNEPIESIYDPRRNREFTDLRAVASNILNTKFKMPYIEITEFLKFKDQNHTNALFASKRADKVPEINKKVQIVLERYQFLKID